MLQADVARDAETAATATTIDPITLEVLWNRLLSVCSEQQAALATAMLDCAPADALAGT